MPAVVCAAVLSMGLLGSATRPVVDGVPPAAEGLAQAAERAFDEGRFEEAAQQASLAVGELEQGPRGLAVAERTRDLQMVWGAALASMGRTGPATGHFRAVLESDPAYAPSADRFAPPIRRRVEKIRREMMRASASPALEVPGTFGTPLMPIEIHDLADRPPPIAPHLAATNAPVVPAAATSPPPPEASVMAHDRGTSPIVWIAVAAVGVAAGVALVALASASSSSQPGLAVGIQSSPGSP